MVTKPDQKKATFCGTYESYGEKKKLSINLAYTLKNQIPVLQGITVNTRYHSMEFDQKGKPRDLQPNAANPYYRRKDNYMTTHFINVMSELVEHKDEPSIEQGPCSMDGFKVAQTALKIMQARALKI